MGGVHKFQPAATQCACIVAFVTMAWGVCRAGDTNDVREQLRLLQQQNQQLQEQLSRQQQMIDSLSRKVSEVDTASQARATELQSEIATPLAISTPTAKPFSF